MSDRYQAAVEALSEPGRENSSLAEPLLDVLPVSGVSVSTLGELLGTETVSASDEQIARVDELQFDLGEGPCWDALAHRRPVIEPDLRGNPPRAWPAFTKAIADEAVAAIFAFPLVIGPLRVGAIDMYRREPGELSREHQDLSLQLAAIVGRRVLRDALLRTGRDELQAEGGFSRRIVHQAVGFVIAQLGVSAEDAELLIQGQAFAENRSMREVAEDIVGRRMRFSLEGDGIEETR
jgi:GAF domain-containing protein